MLNQDQLTQLALFNSFKAMQFELLASTSQGLAHRIETDLAAAKLELGKLKQPAPKPPADLPPIDMPDVGVEFP